MHFNILLFTGLLAQLGGVTASCGVFSSYPQWQCDICGRGFDYYNKISACVPQNATVCAIDVVSLIWLLTSYSSTTSRRAIFPGSTAAATLVKVDTSSSTGLISK
jgi:hypothetical protein